MTISDKKRAAQRKLRSRPFDPGRLALLIDQFDDGNKTAAARRIGIAQPTLWNILKGKYNPRTPTLELLARAYGVTVDFMYGRTERTQDDTFESGARAIIRSIRRELDHLEERIELGEVGPKAGDAVRTEVVRGDLPPIAMPTRGAPKPAGPTDRKTTPTPALQKRRGSKRA